MKRQHLVRLLVLPVFVLLLDSCKDNKAGSTPVSIYLTDSPGDYDAVYVDIQSVSLHVVNSEGGGWQQIQLLHPGVYNLLDFQNGIDTLIAGAEIPSGTISQIRFVLGNNNSVVKDGQTHSLSVPSAQQSGLKLNLHDELLPDIAYRLWIDFDASRSIVETGSGKYSLKPVIRTYTQATGGTLKGFVLPEAANAKVWAILGTDSIAAYPTSTGYFLIAGLQPGTSWKVWFDADDATGYHDYTQSNIPISAGQVTDLGQITLQ